MCNARGFTVIGQREQGFNGIVSSHHDLLKLIVCTRQQKSERTRARKEEKAKRQIVFMSEGKNLNNHIFVLYFTNLKPRPRVSLLLKHHL